MSLYIYGKHPLEEVLLKKKEIVEEVYITKTKTDDASLQSLFQKTHTSYRIVTEEELEHLTGKGVVHQGVGARINERMLYSSLEDCLREESTKHPCFILLDELEDPHNVGAIIRSAVAFGASGVLFPSHGQTFVNGTVVKTSTGTVFSIPLIPIGNVHTTLSLLKDKGYWVYALSGDGDTSLHDASFDTPTVLVIGSEGKGVREKTKTYADFRLAIPISEDCESLNASNAVAVTLYEWSKQQKRRA